MLQPSPSRRHRRPFSRPRPRRNHHHLSIGLGISLASYPPVGVVRHWSTDGTRTAGPDHETDHDQEGWRVALKIIEDL